VRTAQKVSERAMRSERERLEFMAAIIFFLPIAVQESRGISHDSTTR
jgi:hypothetical protein